MKVLVLSRNYPNNVTELLGLWVQRLVCWSARFCDVKVISPVPHCPPWPGLPESYRRFRRVERNRMERGVEIFHPRFVSGPGYSTYELEPSLYLLAVRRLVARLRNTFDFDLIHAHFTYPDGLVAMELGKRYGVPVVVTEHVPWDVWSNRYQKVRQRAGTVAAACFRHISVSSSVLRTVEDVVGKQDNLVVIPNGVDGSIFGGPDITRARSPGRVLFVGAVRPVKGVDILVRAFRILADRGCPATLDIVGEAFFEDYRKEEARLRRMVVDCGVEDRIHFLGKRRPEEVATLMSESSLLVLPSRAESFGMVLAEALACGTPVVSTRCGGPEDIVSEQVGILVNPEDPVALADAIQSVLDRRVEYAPLKLRTYALEKFGLQPVGERLRQVYAAAVLHGRGNERVVSAGRSRGFARPDKLSPFGGKG